MEVQETPTPRKQEFDDENSSDEELEAEQRFLIFDTLPFPWVEDVYIRAVYEEFYDLVRQRRKVVVIGNPGIGKSLFGIYLLHRMIKEGVPVVYFRSPYFYYFDRNGTPALESGLGILQGKGAIYDALYTENACYIHDCCTKGKVLHDEPHARLIVLSSPTEDNYADVVKDNSHARFIMPPWSMQEVQVLCAFLGANKDKVREKFLNFGGIPRYIFGDDEASYEDTRKSQIISCSGDSFLRSLQDLMKNEDSHMIFHMKSKKNNRSQYVVKFASKRTGDEICKSVRTSAL